MVKGKFLPFITVFHGQENIIRWYNAVIRAQDFPRFWQIDKDIVNIHADIPVFLNGIVSLHIGKVGRIVHLSLPVPRKFHYRLVSAHLVHGLHHPFDICINYG